MAASFLFFLSSSTPREKASRKPPFFEGMHMTSRRGRSVGKLPTHAVFVFPHPAALCFSWPDLSPDLSLLIRLGVELRGITSQIICTAIPNAVHRMLSNVVWLQLLPLIYHVCFLCHSQGSFLSLGRLWDCQRKLRFLLLRAMDQNSVYTVHNQMI